jgi:thymidylate synthase (FAD)
MNVRLIAKTTSEVLTEGPNPRPLSLDELIVYVARVSSPQNQAKHEDKRLLNYCMRHGHWSVFETGSLTFEVETSMAIAVQILRHWSMRFQQFSQRYSEVEKLGALLEPIRLRLKAVGGNRQGSGEEISADDPLQTTFDESVAHSVETYLYLLKCGVAPESARFCLPLAVKTRIYITGSPRSWIHYFKQRESSHAQKEHQIVAHELRRLFNEQLPVVSAAMEHEEY